MAGSIHGSDLTIESGTDYNNERITLTMTRILTAAILAIIVSACSSKLHIPTYQTSNTVAHANDELSIQYLGVGGHLMRYKGAALMTAPSFTNPHFLRVGPLMPISSDTETVDRYMPPADDVSMILVGHAHYDHLMDVPHVMNTQAKNADVYGSETMKNSIMSKVDKNRIHALNDLLGDNNAAGQWVYNKDRSIRIMGLKSSHAPHFMGITFMRGEYDKPRESLPWHAFGWKEGQTIAYIIDFMDAENVAYRVYYQDSASQQPAGLVPDIADGKAIDIAILCPASFAQVDDYPESVMASTEARHFILGHWEDFFSNDPAGKQRFVRATSQDDFMERFRAALPATSSWAMPELFSTQYFNHQGLIN